MHGDDLKVVNGDAAGAWIESRLEGEFGAVTLQVPNGFEAYVRVFHPACDPEGKRVRWADVAKARGTTPHREMQWHAVLGGLEWPGFDPAIGEMDVQTLDALCRVLAGHLADRGECFFGLCTIVGWLDSFSTDELQPLLGLPHDRDYVVLSGPLSAVDQIAYDWSTSSSFRMSRNADKLPGQLPEAEVPSLSRRQAPQLIWPEDHSWLMATEVDFDSTLVGGSAGLIAAIIESTELEAWQVEPTDSLAVDADKLNVRRGRD